MAVTPCHSEVITWEMDSPLQGTAKGPAGKGTAVRLGSTSEGTRAQRHSPEPVLLLSLQGRQDQELAVGATLILIAHNGLCEGSGVCHLYY